MILTADIGNTQTVLGLWYGNRLLSTAHLSTKRYSSQDEWIWAISQWLREEKDKIRLPVRIEKAVVASVVPVANQIFRESLYEWGIPSVEFLESQSTTPVQFEYEGRATLGADRVANALAGISLFGPNIIIADFGTANTFCLIADRVFRGGLIAPGIQGAVESLFSGTAKLPQVNFKNKAHVLGSTTIESIENGVYFGWRGLTREILRELTLHPFARGKSFVKIATGGMSVRMNFTGELFDVVDRYLTLRGLNLYAQM